MNSSKVGGRFATALGMWMGVVVGIAMLPGCEDENSRTREYIEGRVLKDAQGCAFSVRRTDQGHMVAKFLREESSLDCDFDPRKEQ